MTVYHAKQDPGVTVAGVRASAALVVNNENIPVLAVDENGNVGLLGRVFCNGRVFSNLDQSVSER
jgi:hypothetical protein